MCLYRGHLDVLFRWTPKLGGFAAGLFTEGKEGQSNHEGKGGERRRGAQSAEVANAGGEQEHQARTGEASHAGGTSGGPEAAALIGSEASASRDRFRGG